MNLIWWVSRPFYLIGAVPVGVLFLIAITNHARDASVSNMIVAGTLAYAALGYLIFSVVPRYFKAQIAKRAQRFEIDGFKATQAAMSVMLNRYVGFDSKAKKALYIDLNEGREELIGFDQVQQWELSPDKSPHPLIKLITSKPDLAVIGVRVKSNQLGFWQSNLRSLFG